MGHSNLMVETAKLGSILIVGGAGYIGSHANKLLAKRGFNTIVLDNLSHGHKESVKWGKLIYGDMADTDLLHTLFSQENIIAVMHFAAFADVAESVIDPQKYYLNNVVNTLNLLNVMMAHKVNKFIFSSSCAIYGSPVAVPILESHPHNPINPYGQSKLMVEKILVDFDKAYGLKSVSLRYFNAAGADPDGEIGEDHHPETHLLPLAIQAAINKNKAIKIFGIDYDTPDGTCIRDYIHVNDLAEAHILALEYLFKGGDTDVFNLGNTQGYSVREVIECVKNISGIDFPVLEVDRRPGDPACLVGSNSKIIRTLSWEAKFSSIEIIVKTAWEWHNRSKKN